MFVFVIGIQSLEIIFWNM